MAQGRSGMPMAPVGGFGQQQQGGFMPQRQLSNFGPYRQGMMGEPGMGMNGFNSGFNRQAPPMSSGYQMPNGGRAGSIPLPPTSLPSQFAPVERNFGGVGPRGFAGGSMPSTSYDDWRPCSTSSRNNSKPSSTSYNDWWACISWLYTCS